MSKFLFVTYLSPIIKALKLLGIRPDGKIICKIKIKDLYAYSNVSIPH